MHGPHASRSDPLIVSYYTQPSWWVAARSPCSYIAFARTLKATSLLTIFNVYAITGVTFPLQNAIKLEVYLQISSPLLLYAEATLNMHVGGNLAVELHYAGCPKQRSGIRLFDLF